MSYTSNCQCFRRQFLKVLLTGNISLLLWLQSSQKAQASGQTEALVLSCIDFRFVNFERNFLEEKGLNNQYDWLTLAGASLALADFPGPAESQTFWDELDLSVRLHGIKKVIILDHQDCGAYATKIDSQLSQNPEQEERIHRKYLSQAYSLLKKYYPNLEVELYFVKLDGQTKMISPLLSLVY